MKDLGAQFQGFIDDMMSNLPMEDIGEVFIESTKTKTEKGLQPSGREFPEYAPSTAKRKGSSSPVTMRDKDMSMNTIYQSAQSDMTSVSFTDKADKYFMHQYKQARGGKERRVFPEEIDYDGIVDELDEVVDIIVREFND